MAGTRSRRSEAVEERAASVSRALENLSLDNDNMVRDHVMFISRFMDRRLYFFPTFEEKSPKGFSLEFLPQQIDINPKLSVLASCNDLLFCRADDYNKVRLYYICNPFTRQWRLLPPPPIRTTNYRIYFGLVCDPNHQGSESQFRVVRLTTEVARHEITVDLYCSETGQWNESLLSGAQYALHITNVVSHDGKLHWYNGTNVVAYDPFNDGQTIVIDASEIRASLPPREIPNNPNWIIIRVGNYRLGVCQGSLRIMHMTCNNASRPCSTDHLSVWELKDCEPRRFSMIHKICFDTMISKEFWVSDFVKKQRIFTSVLCFHPENKDVVYLGIRHKIISYNIHRGELEFIDEIPYENHFNACENVFTVKLPSSVASISFDIPPPTECLSSGLMQ